MLTDYHVHLRPDEAGTTAELYFTEQNAARYREAATGVGVAELGVSEHIYRFSDALTIWQHDLWQKSGVDDLTSYCGYVKEVAGFKLGIEADFIPGREDKIANLLDSHPFDYVIGSVHFLGDEAVDHLDYDIWNGTANSERVWKRYFETLAEAARSGLFDILAHPDLVKVWGRSKPWPEGDLRRFYEPAVEAVAESGIAIEVSTAGWRKPVDEIYPAAAFFEMLLEAGAKVALSSDAHLPEHVGYGYDRAVDYLKDHGVSELSVFTDRKRSQVPLG